MLEEMIYELSEILEKAEPINKYCGVYFLIFNGEVVYVGKSTNVYNRLASHLNDKSKIFDKWAWFPVPQKDLDSSEMLHIFKYFPVYNEGVSGNYTRLELSSILGLEQIYIDKIILEYGINNVEMKYCVKHLFKAIKQDLGKAKPVIKREKFREQQNFIDYFQDNM